jgi:hypothetical protein
VLGAKVEPQGNYAIIIRLAYLTFIPGFATVAESSLIRIDNRSAKL